MTAEERKMLQQIVAPLNKSGKFPKINILDEGRDGHINYEIELNTPIKKVELEKLLEDFYYE